MKRIKRDKVFQVIVDQLENAIATGELKPGDKLPPELKLTKMFASSRSSVREAFRILEQKGLIHIKRGAGGGAIVSEMDTRKVTENFSLLLQAKQVRFDHMAEFRKIIEGEVSALAACRNKKSGVARLNKILDKARLILEKDPDNWGDFYDLDIQFHVEVGQIAGNPVFTALLNMVHQDILGQDDRFALPDHGHMRQNFADLERIAAAIEAGDPAAAQKASVEHVQAFNRHMKDQQNLFTQPKAKAGKKKSPGGVNKKRLKTPSVRI